MEEKIVSQWLKANKPGTVIVVKGINYVMIYQKGCDIQTVYSMIQKLGGYGEGPCQKCVKFRLQYKVLAKFINTNYNFLLHFLHKSKIAIQNVIQPCLGSVHKCDVHFTSAQGRN